MRKILIVDDSIESSQLLKRILMKRGYPNIILSRSAEEAFNVLSPNDGPSDIDLVLLDIVMPGMDGIEACLKIKQDKKLRDIPIIMVTGMDKSSVLEQAFQAGAMDYIKKPYDILELHARVRNALNLKREMDKRKARELELLEVTEELKELNRVLEQLSNIDGLTGVANRRSFDAYLETEWNRAAKNGEELSLLLFDIDKFKLYNDTYGHQEGDDCLKRIAQIFTSTIKRPGDFAARYGGEEFVAVLPNTTLESALDLAEQLRKQIESEKIPHVNSPVSKYVTISIGVASAKPIDCLCTPEELINLADQGLYEGKRNGRNQVRAIQLKEEGVNAR